MEQKREEGYYWVKNDGTWVIAYWSEPRYPFIKGAFTICGDELSFKESHFEEIDETRIPNKK